MARRKQGRACVVRSGLSPSDWPDVLDGLVRKRRVTARCSSVRQSIVDVASDIMGQRFNPTQYVLTHATIVASVSTYAPEQPDQALSGGRGKLLFTAGSGMGFASVDPRMIFSLGGGGFTPNRYYPDFRITRPTQKFINDNNDAFSRGVLQKSYKTFVGSHNFIEHMQIEALSKGRILDTALRDIGPTLYCDILVATDRGHEELCAGILDGSIDKMSMGCDIVGSICSCCGHWSVDDTELCPCIRHFKGQTFTDDDGEPSRIAEICGHESIEPTGGVVFKEASWVEGPAFKGAVARGVIDHPEVVSVGKVAAQKVVAGSWTGEAPRTASRRRRADETPEFGEGDPGDPGEAPPDDQDGDIAPVPGDSNPVDDAVEQVRKYIFDRALSKIRENIDSQNLGDEVPGVPDDNDNLTRLAVARRGKQAVASFARAARSDEGFVRGLPALMAGIGVNLSPRFASAVGSAAPLLRAGRVAEFLTRCGLQVGRPLNRREAEMAIRIARMMPGTRRLNNQTLSRAPVSGRDPG